MSKGDSKQVQHLLITITCVQTCDWVLNVTTIVCAHRCPNLLQLTLSGCGHITDQDVISVLQSCRKLCRLHLENCVRITDCSLQEGVVAHGDSLEEVKVDFCRNVTQEGLQAIREKRPGIQLSAERSADMIPDSKPVEKVPLRRTLQKVLLFSWGKCFTWTTWKIWFIWTCPWCFFNDFYLYLNLVFLYPFDIFLYNICCIWTFLMSFKLCSTLF